MRILLSNDDGIDSAALIPTIKSLETIGDVEVVVPNINQSWTSKANSRSLKKIKKEVIEKEGHKIITLDALPADCSNYGLYRDELPDLLVTGANLGHNVGLSAFLSSGTVGSSLEGLLAGVPSISVSSPYTFGESLTSEKFAVALKSLPNLAKKFIEQRLDNFAMLAINLPINVENPKFIATTITKWVFGKLFEDGDDWIKPINYPLLNQECSAEPLTDTWAKDNKYNSIIILDHNAQVIDRQIVEDWLKLVDLYDIRSEIIS